MKLEIRNVTIAVEGKEIIRDLSLTIQPGETHAIMGPNGSGKSSLSQALIGNTKYEITTGEILMDEKNLLEMKPDERLRQGLFLGFQYPREIEGVRISTFLKAIYENKCKAVMGDKYKPTLMIHFTKTLEGLMTTLGIDTSYMHRYLNHGFSGGEKKKLELLQMCMVDPRYVIMDEIDSGLDIDALRVISTALNNYRSKDTGLLLITHYDRILQQVKPDFVHIMVDGRIVRSGGYELAGEVEKSGYESFKLKVVN
jgi:Fe-S cluster assembly ATP-binding protein